MRSDVLVLLAVLFAPAVLQAQKPRERDLKLPIGGTPGRSTPSPTSPASRSATPRSIAGSGKLVVGTGPVRTGVTVIHPRGKANPDPVFAAWFTLNGNGEMTGTTWVQESGLLEGPVAITNTHSVGVVRDAIIQWEVSQKNALQPWWLPVVAETYDGGLNDINGFHVKPEHVTRGARRRRRAACRRKARSAAAPGWSATASRAASARRRANFPPHRADTPSACWCSATTARGATCGSPACRSVRRFRISPAASRTTIRCRRLTAAALRSSPAARRDRGRRNRARSSSSSRPTRRCCRTS